MGKKAVLSRLEKRNRPLQRKPAVYAASLPRRQEKIMEKYENMSLAALLAHAVSLIRTLVSDQKTYLKTAVQGSVRTGLTGITLGGAGLIFLALSGVFLLITLTLLLNVWFPPWASALIMTFLLLLCGLVLGIAGMRTARRGVRRAQVDMGRIKEDIAWLKES